MNMTRHRIQTGANCRREQRERPAAAAPWQPMAFTLIELLVVISLIALVAGMIIAGGAGIIVKGKQARVQAERDRLETVIEHYKVKLGYFPPDNPANPAVNQLFYELTGTTNTGGGSTFYTFNGQTIAVATINSAFGRKGLANSSSERDRVQNFYPIILPAAYKEISSSPRTSHVLVVPFDGPNPITAVGGKPINTWRYNSSAPRYNR